MASVIYFTRSKNDNYSQEVSIRVRFRHGKKINLYAKSGYTVLPENFSNETHTVRQRAAYKEKDRMKKNLHNLSEFIQDEFKKLKTPPDNDWLNTTIDKYHNPKKYEKPAVTLFSFIEDFVNKAPQRINRNTGKPVCYKMQREYVVTWNYFKNFCKEQGREYDFNDIDINFIDSFVSFLINEGLQTNTVHKKIQTLKTFLNNATLQGYNKNMKFKNPQFNIRKKDPETVYLTEDELQKIHKYDLSNNPKLERVRDLFLVQAWTGVRFSDLKQINSDHIQGNIIKITQSKTGKTASIPLLPVTKNILDKYNGILPRLISNQKYNEYLKELCKIKELGLNTPFFKTELTGGATVNIRLEKWEAISSHTARRSFATNMYLKGYPVISIMSITGHKTEAAFLRYIRISEDEHAKIIADKWNDHNLLKVV